MGSSPTGHPTKNPLMLCIGGFFYLAGVSQWDSNKAALTHQRQSNQQPSGLLVSLRVPISRNSTKTNAVLILCIGGFFYLVGYPSGTRTATTTTAACGRNREELLGPCSDFSKPCQGAAEKSANTTRKALTVRFCCGFHPLGMSTGEPSAAVQNSGFFYLVGVLSGTRTAHHYFLLKKHVQNTSGRNGSCVLCTCFLLFDIHPHGQRLICCRICAISALE